jgi:uncharacterized protein YbbK (DUF523 family)
MEAVLVSACLLGAPVRYNGGGARCEHALLALWQAQGRVVAVCPEVAGGLPTPRPPAEIRGGLGGQAVLMGQAAVIESTGRDVSAAFVSGAQQAVALARARGIRVAVLKEGSPSCGSDHVHDGSFSGTRIAGLGVTAAALTQIGVRVFSERQLAEAASCLDQPST